MQWQRNFRIAMITLCVGATSCGASGSRTPTDASPLDRLLFGSQGDRDTFTRLLEKAMNNCMTHNGFRWFVEPPPVESPVEDYGVTRTPEKGRSGPNEEYVASLSAETSAAYSQAVRICISKANDSVARSRENYRLLPTFLELKRQADRLVAADPAVVEAVHRWSACMGEAGWEFANPTEPSRVILAKFNSLDPLSQAMLPDDGSPAVATPDPTVMGSTTLESLQAIEMQIFRQDRRCAVVHLDKVTADKRNDIESQLLVRS